MRVRRQSSVALGLLVAAGLLLDCSSQTEPRTVTDAFERDIEQWRKARFERCDLAEAAKFPPGVYPIRDGTVALEVTLYPHGLLEDVRVVQAEGLTQEHVDCLIVVVTEMPFHEMRYCQPVSGEGGEGAESTESTENDEGDQGAEWGPCSFTYTHAVAAGRATSWAPVTLQAATATPPSAGLETP